MKNNNKNIQLNYQNLIEIVKDILQGNYDIWNKR
jgi:hypothetical protein